MAKLVLMADKKPDFAFYENSLEDTLFLFLGFSLSLSITILLTYNLCCSLRVLENFSYGGLFLQCKNLFMLGLIWRVVNF